MNNTCMDIEELENKPFLTLEEFKQLGHVRMQQLIKQEVAC